MKLFSSILILSIVLLHQAVAQKCESRDNKCECVFPDGTGYSFHDIVQGDSFLEAKTDQNLTFYYHPCGDSMLKADIPSGVQNDCANGYSFCMYNKTNASAVVLGKLEHMSFEFQDGLMQLIFVKEDAPEDLKKSSITLQCVPNAIQSVLYAGSQVKQVNLLLFSKNGCTKVLHEGHGFFYTLTVVLLTLLFSYLVIGILVNYFLVGARGYELIPNFDTWSKVWRSLKLGFIYVKNGCRVIPADDSYDAI